MISFLSPTGDTLKALSGTLVSLPSHKEVPARADIVFVVDRSGSMWGQMDHLKSTLGRVLGVYEALGTSADLTLSLVSYSSDGDVTEHFRHIPIQDAPQAPSVQRGINELAPTGLTGMSQGLKKAETLGRVDRMLLVILMSDGYCNDPSPRQEKDACLEIAERLRRNGATVLTVAYGWADFPTLSQIATLGGGTCYQAGSAPDLYRSFEAAIKTAAKLQQTNITIPIEDGEMLVMIDPSTRTIKGSVGADLVLTASPGPGTTIYRLGPGTSPVDVRLTLAVSRALLQEGQVDLAKQAAIGSGSVLARKFWRAISPSDLKEMAATLDQIIFDSGAIETESGSVIPTGPSIMDVMEVISNHQFEVKTSSFERYQRRSLSRNAGSWVEGKFVPFDTHLEAEKSEYLPITNVITARNMANLSLQVMSGAKLVRGGVEIPEVAGIKLDSLKSFRNYTVVADGKVYVDELTVRTTDKRAEAELRKLGLVVTDGVCTIPFSKMAVMKTAQVEVPTRKTLRGLQHIVALQKILSAMLPKTESAKFDPSQVEELKKVGLTPNLNFSPPTVYPFEGSTKEALAKGLIDNVTVNRVYLGTLEAPDMLGSKVFKSGNDYLDRRFKTASGEEVDGTLILKGVKFEEKPLSARSKPHLSDEVMFPVFQGVLGTKDTPEYNDVLRQVFGGRAEQVKKEIEEIRSGTLAVATAIGKINTMSKQIATYLDLAWQEIAGPLVLYVGATGQLPQGLKGTRIAADKVPGASSDEKVNGTFIQVGEVLLTIVSESDYVPLAA